MRRLTRSNKPFIPQAICLAILLLCVAFTQTATAAVQVYAEGAYTDTDLVLYIYADIDPAILSFGVRVNYPDGLTVTNSTKNDAVWYFGEDAPGHAYMDPEDDGSGVVIIGGKLDTDEPDAGVAGDRVLLGTVTFSHSGVTDFSGVTLAYGRGDGTSDFKNFVETNGAELDGTAGVTFAVTVRERGDANADTVLTFADMSAVRAMITNNEYVVYADCNNDGVLTFADMSCIRSKL